MQTQPRRQLLNRWQRRNILDMWANSGLDSEQQIVTEIWWWSQHEFSQLANVVGLVIREKYSENEQI